MEDKLIIVKQYSNPRQVAENALRYFGKPVPIYISNKPISKYMIQDPSGKFVHFGAIPYEDYTFHQDTDKQFKYLKKTMNIRGRWMMNPYSPNNLSINLLWT